MDSDLIHLHLLRFEKLHLEMVGPIDKWEEIDYVYDMDLLASSLAAQLLR